MNLTARTNHPSLPQLSRQEPVVGNYFIAAYPPFSCWSPSETPAMEEVLQQPAPKTPFGLYLHIPFCQKKCNYCYYLSYVGQTPEVVNRYLDTVLKELALYTERPAFRERPVSFVYFGGGTPSTLTAGQVRHLGCGLHALLPWGEVEEITFECAPRSVRPDFLEALKVLGVTRLSMGVQSFDDGLLRSNGRIHLSGDISRAYAQIRSAGFGWVNLDLMVGLLGETWEQWEDSVRRMIDLNPESVTIYQTEIPFNTQIYRDLQKGFVTEPVISWEIKRERLLYAFQELNKAGYSVASAYSAVKDPARHRFVYQDYLWRGDDMLGLGVASFGYVAGVPYQNEVTLEKYELQVAQGLLPLKRAFRLTERDQLVREFILQLKLGPISPAEFRAKFGLNIAKIFLKQMLEMEAEGMLSFSDSQIAFTRAGLLCADRLLSRFYDPQFQDLRYS